VFERFTDRARRVVVLAQGEAVVLGHPHIGTEHLLLGLIHEGEGVAAMALESMDIALEAVRSQVEEIIGQDGPSRRGRHIPFTPRAKKVLELSLREALQLGHDYIGTEHILLGLLREGDGLAAQVLVKLGADLGSVRTAVISLLGEGMVADQPPADRELDRPPDERRGAQRIFARRRIAMRPGREEPGAGATTPRQMLAQLAASPSAAGSELRAAGIEPGALAGAPEREPVDARAPVSDGDLVEHLAHALAHALGGEDAEPGDDHLLVVLLSPHRFGLVEIVGGLGADPLALRRSALARL